MRIPLRLNGIYSEEMVSTAKQEGVSAISFDYRPKELTFIQHYKVLEMLPLLLESSIDIVLQFGEEKNEVIEVLLKDIFDGFPSLVPHISLEFSGPWRDVEFLKIPYSWRGLNNFDHESTYLSGYVVGPSDLENLGQKYLEANVGSDKKLHLDIELDSLDIKNDFLKKFLKINSQLVLLSSHYSPAFRKFDHDSFRNDVNFFKERVHENTYN